MGIEDYYNVFFPSLIPLSYFIYIITLLFKKFLWSPTKMNDKEMKIYMYYSACALTGITIGIASLVFCYVAYTSGFAIPQIIMTTVSGIFAIVFTMNVTRFLFKKLLASR